MGKMNHAKKRMLYPPFFEMILYTRNVQGESKTNCRSKNCTKVTTYGISSRYIERNSFPLGGPNKPIGEVPQLVSFRGTETNQL